MRFYTDQNRTCFQYESGTYAATSGARQWLGLVQDHSIEPNMNVIPIRYQGSTDRNVDDFADGRKEWNGTISYFPQDWKFLGFAIGSMQDVSGTAAGIYHTFTETNSDNRIQTTPTSLTSFTIEDSKNIGNAGSNFIRTVIGGMVNNYQLSLSQGEIISAEVNYIAQNSTMSSGAVAACAASTTDPYMFNNATLELPEDTEVSNMKEGTVTVTNNIEPGFYLNGSRTASEMMPMNREYEVTATCDMDDGNARTLYDSYYIAGSEFNGTMKVWGTTGSLTLYMSGCKMTEMTVPSVLEGVQEQSFTFTPSHVNGTAYVSTVLYNLW